MMLKSCRVSCQCTDLLFAWCHVRFSWPGRANLLTFAPPMVIFDSLYGYWFLKSTYMENMERSMRPALRSFTRNRSPMLFFSLGLIPIIPLVCRLRRFAAV